MSGLFVALILVVVIFGFSWLQMYVYRRIWSRNLYFDMQTSNPAVFEGEKITLTDSLINANRLPLPWIHISYKLSRCFQYMEGINKKIARGERRSLVFVVGVRKTMSVKSSVVCARRGHYHASNLLITSNNLLMTHYETEKRDLRFTQLVYPKIVDYPEAMIPFKRMLGDVTVRRFIDPDPFTFKGIREYQPYDAFRQINWSAAVKTGVLMSNIYDFTVTQDITIFLNLQRYNRFERSFVHEEAIRLAAFYCRACIGMGIPVSLVCPARDGKPMRITGGLSRAHLETIYAALAYIDLTIWNASVIDYLPSVSDRAAVLISSYHDNDMREKFFSMRERCEGSLWVIPYYGLDEVGIENGIEALGSIMTLEVKKEDYDNV